MEKGTAYGEEHVRLVWEEPSEMLMTGLPFRVGLSAVGEDKELIQDYHGHLTITAVTSKLCLAEGFEGRRLGLWLPNHLPGHYEHGFDDTICADDSGVSLFLKGGNDSNFGMTLKLPSPTAVDPDAADGAPATLLSDAETDDPLAFDGNFRPDSVTFYVRTDNAFADAGHFILGESNEVNKRVAQFQFTKDGRMGLLGTGGTTHGATRYEPDRWYLVELRFDWEKKQVAFYVDQVLQQRNIPFRRETSNFIGACALGNRDKCTTWFDSIRFMRETRLFRTEVSAKQGRTDVWVGPLLEEAASEGFVLRVEDSAGNVGEVLGPLYPLSRSESAERVAINSTALENFTRLLDEPASADVVFMVEGKPLHAHRCILTARCEAFCGMFNSAMREGSQACREVPVQEASHPAFRCMLQFIYGGAVQVPEELAVELLGLADRYLLSGLKLLCGFTLQKMITVDTVVRIIQAADRWDAPSSQLKSRCMDYILTNYEAVVSHAVFDELGTSPQLLLEIVRAAARIVSTTATATSPTGVAFRPNKRARKSV